MFGLPELPDFSKITPLLDESIEMFRKLTADVELIKKQQVEILELLREQSPHEVAKNG